MDSNLDLGMECRYWSSESWGYGMVKDQHSPIHSIRMFSNYGDILLTVISIDSTGDIHRIPNTMHRLRTHIIFSLLAAFVAVLFATGCASESSQPNIIYILADDLGYRELGSYGQEIIQTPRLDQLAEQGMRFTQHYSGSPVCAPSRGTLLTGKDTGHGYIRDNFEMGGWGPDEPEGQLPLPDEEITIAEILKPLGYKTGFVGKWGLGGPDSEGRPNRQGFDHFYGYLCQRVAHNYYPTHLWHDTNPDSLEGNAWFSAHQRLEEPLETDEAYYERYLAAQYAPDLMLQSALSFVEENRNDPFFLVFATPVPHLALQVPPESLEQYDSLSESGPYLGQRGYLPHPRPLAAYAAMISRMDSDIGRLLDLVDELGLADNTIVMFSSDNGTTYTGGVDAEYFNSVGDLRGLKGSVFEGGIRVPMIARWPGIIGSGSVTDHVSAFWDIMPTIADVTGATVPEDINGISFLPVLEGNDEEQVSHESLYWEYHAFGGMQAVRMGEWKAVRREIRRQDNAPVELYNLTLDIGEHNNVADQHPEIVAAARSVMDSRRPSEIERWNFIRDKRP